MTVAEAIRQAARALDRAGVPDAATDARRLMAHALGLAPDRLLLVQADRLGDVAAELFARQVEERRRRRPLAQIVGSRLFWGRDFLVTEDVLDPRPETETLVAEALAGRFSSVLDLGTGSGCLLVTLLAERPGASGAGTDVSEAALAVARANARRHGVEGRARWQRADWLAGVEGRFDLIVSNPPYVAAGEMAGLEPEVRLWEPRLALTDGGDGLSAYRAILSDAARVLAPGGRVMVEVGASQAPEVLALGRALGWGAAETRPDLDGRARLCLFRASSDPR